MSTCEYIEACVYNLIQVTEHRTLYIFMFYIIVVQLIYVGLFGLAVLLIYAVLSFAFFHNFFKPYDMDYNLFCNTSIQCYVTVIREGLLDSLGAVSRLFNSHVMFALSHVTFRVDCYMILLFVTVDTSTSICRSK